MFRRSSRSRNKSAGVLGRAASATATSLLGRHCCEPLERRRLLIVLSGGGMAGNMPIENTFEYVEQSGQDVRIALWGDVDVVAVFSRVSLDDAHVELANPAQYVGTTAPTTGTDLFELYILDAQPGASISIAAVPAPSTSATGRPMQPTAGTIGSIVGFQNNAPAGDASIAAAGGTGAVYIGTRFVAPATPSTPDLTTNRPILGIPDTHLFPGPGGGSPIVGLPTPKNGVVLAGIYSAAGVSLNRLFIGGTITGNVQISGSVEDFYAGNIWTGMRSIQVGEEGLGGIPGADNGIYYGESYANGTTYSAATARNFEIGGDLEQLDVTGGIGTDVSVFSITNTTGPDLPNLNTGFQLYVAGQLGSVNCRSSIVGTVHVVHSPSAPTMGFSQTKIALSGAPVPPDSSASFFEGNQDLDQGVPSLYDPGLQQLFGNGSFGQAQYLGTLFNSDLGSNTATVDGYLDGTTGGEGANDYDDWYAVPLMAGQSVTATLTVPNLAENPTMASIISNEFSGLTAKEINDELAAELTEIRLGVFDPEVIKSVGGAASGSGGSNGAEYTNPTRLIASTYTNTALANAADSLKFTAEEPGTYYFAIAFDGDINFNGVVDGTATTVTGDNEADFINDGFAAYELRIGGVGNLGAGAIEAANSITTGTPIDESRPVAETQSIYVTNGDLGAVTCPSSETLTTAGGVTTVTLGSNPPGGTISDAYGNPIYVNKGNLRDVEGTAIGITVGGSTTPGISAEIRSAILLEVPNGSVGMMRTTDPSTGMYFNLENAGSNVVQPAPDIPAVGGDYQMIDAAGNLTANVKAGRSIGEVRAGSIGNLLGDPGSFQINANGKPEGGVIDDIDDAGVWGTDMDGGPAILDGPGGNVRYMTVAGIMYRDAFFGGVGNPDTLVAYPAGQAVNLIDDSGTAFTITPIPLKSMFVTTSTGIITVPGKEAGQVFLQTYPVRDSGGVIVTNLDVKWAINPLANGEWQVQGGVTITANAKGPGGSVDLGDVGIEAGTDNGALSGTTTFDPNNSPEFSTTAPPVTAVFQGNVPINVYDLFTGNNVQFTTTGIAGGTITGQSGSFNETAVIDPPVTTGTVPGFTSITNNTSGEMVNVEAGSIGTFTAQTIGLAKSDVGGSVVGGYNIRSTTFPFNQQHNLIDISGDAGAIEARGGLGNILVGSGTSGGTIGTLEADTANKFATSSQTFAGIDAPVFAEALTEPTPVTIGLNVGYVAWPEGNILNANVGQGLMGGGTGDHPIAGVYASNFIGNVTNQGAGSDIHGPIVAAGAGGGLGPVIPSAKFVTPATLNVDLNNLNIVHDVDVTDGALLSGEVLAARLTDSLTIIRTKILSDAGSDTLYTGFPSIEPEPLVMNSIQTVNSTGRDAGMLETVIAGVNIGSVTTSGGFGFIDSTIQQPPQSTLATLSADGYGIRNSTFDGGINTNLIDAVGGGKLIDVRQTNPSARPSSTGIAYDPFSGELLNAGNDLDLAFRVNATKPKRIGASEAGTLAGDLFTGGLNLGTLQAWRFGEPGDTTSANRISFGLTISNIKVADSMYYTRINSGGITTTNIKGQMFNSSLAVSGPIGTVNVGFVKVNSSITSSGPDGTIGTIDVGNGFMGTLISSVSLGALIVGGDFGSTDVYDPGAFGTLDVGGSVLTGSSVLVRGTLSDLVIKKNFAGTVQAKALTHKSIKGHNTGKIIIG